MNRTCQTIAYAATVLACLVFCRPGAARGEEPFGLDAVFEVFEAVVEELVPAPPRAKVQIQRQEVQIKQMAPQLAQQLRPMLHSELAFIRQMCELPIEHRPKVRAAGEAALEKAGRLLAQQQFGVNRGMLGGANEPSDPRQLIADALAGALKESISAEQLAEYSREAAQRTARRKRAAILSAIAVLDEALFLTAEQRTAISESVESHWQADWEQWTMLQQYGGQYFPQIPDNYVVPHLNQEQRSVWNGLQKVSFGSWSGAEGQVPVDDGWWGEDAAKPAGAAAGRAIDARNVLLIPR